MSRTKYVYSSGFIKECDKREIKKVSNRHKYHVKNVSNRFSVHVLHIVNYRIPLSRTDSSLTRSN